MLDRGPACGAPGARDGSSRSSPVLIRGSRKITRPAMDFGARAGQSAARTGPPRWPRSRPRAPARTHCDTRRAAHRPWPRQVSLDDQSDRRGRSQITRRLVTEPVQRIGLADDVSPTSKSLLELPEAGLAKQFHMTAAVRGGSELDDVEFLGGFDPGCSVDGTALVPVKPEVTLPGVDPRDLRASTVGQRSVASPSFGIRAGVRGCKWEQRERQRWALIGGSRYRRPLARSIDGAEDSSAQQAAGNDVGLSGAGVEALPAIPALQ
jgi:hypothetical protein